MQCQFSASNLVPGCQYFDDPEARGSNFAASNRVRGMMPGWPIGQDGLTENDRGLNQVKSSLYGVQRFAAVIGEAHILFATETHELAVPLWDSLLNG